eukprot:scaffold103911_cov36-Prasinocladus_malaysianus.AAC.1
MTRVSPEGGGNPSKPAKTLAVITTRARERPMLTTHGLRRNLSHQTAVGHLRKRKDVTQTEVRHELSTLRLRFPTSPTLAFPISTTSKQQHANRKCLPRVFASAIQLCPLTGLQARALPDVNSKSGLEYRQWC